ncbi:MAG: LamG-like jellyroll fold domain-containing protein [Verrucomicrobiota bacterium]
MTHVFPARIFAAAFAIFITISAHAQTLNIANDVQTAATLTNTTVTMTGRSELHITGTGDPITGSIINLNSTDAWFFLRNIRPSVVHSTFLSRLRVNGAAAVLNANVRIVQYEAGTVVIPHGPTFKPLEIFDGTHFTGPSKSLGLHTYYHEANLGILSAATSSFKLKRGYMATVAQQNTGMGSSKVYIAQDGDLEISILPAALNNNIRYVRVFPWRWVLKKGWGGGDGWQMNHYWNYGWDAGGDSNNLDSEYVPMRHGPWWPGFDEINAKQNVTHLLGYNEPDNTWDPAQTPQTVDQAIAQWPELMKSGLRLGSPAVTEGGLNSWLYPFIDRCDQLGYRVDFVAVHFYGANYDAWGLHELLRTISERTRRPVWLTEFNNGASWNDSANNPTQAQNAIRINEFIDMMDGWAPYVERYAIYNWVGDNRRMVWNGGSPTEAGPVYRDQVSSPSQAQAFPETATAVNAGFLFEGNANDSSGNGHNSIVMGTPGYAAGKSGQAISFDGISDHLRLSSKLGDSTDFSFTGWLYWNGGTNTNWQRIFDLGDGEAKFVALVPKSGDTSKLRFVMKNGGAEQRLDAPNALPIGAWTHVGVTLSGDTGKLFVNGVPVATSTTMTLNPVDVATVWNYLGKAQFAADPLYNGKMDDIRFHNSALTDAQVLASYNNLSPQFTANPLAKADATKLQPCSGTLAGDATDANAGSVLKFNKLGGPAWLNLAGDGKFTGIPGLNDTGVNSFQVTVTDPVGASAVTTLTINVKDLPGTEQRYAFDGNANASAGPADGVTTGGPAYVAGKLGQAIDLDGTDDFVTLPSDVASSTDITVAAWVNWDGGAGWQRIFDFGSGTMENIFLCPASAGTPRMTFAIKNGGAEQVMDAPPLVAGQWTHVAVTLNGNTGKLYVNGVVADTDTNITINPGDFRAATNYIGKSQWPDPLFNGRIDEFFIDNNALTDAQIAALMNNRAPRFTADPINKPDATGGQSYYHSIIRSATDADAGDTLTYGKVSGPAWLHVAANGALSGTPDSGNTGSNRFVVRVTDSRKASDDAVLNINVSGATGLMATYQLDSNLLDTTGTRHGAGSGGPVYGNGRHDKAVILDGVDDFVTLPATIANHGSITVAARVKWNGGANWQRIFDFGNGTTQYVFLAPNGRFAIKNGGAEQILDTAALPVGEWVHVAVTLGANTGNLYVNGALASTAPITLSPANFNPTLNYLGKSQYAADPLFNGTIDDFRIYHRVLTTAEVSSLAIPNLGISGGGIQPLTIPFVSWAFQFDFPSSQGGPNADADSDGVPNLMEYLFDSNPLGANSNLLPTGDMKTGGEIGLAASPGKHYLSFQARVRKNRGGVTLVPQAAGTLDGLSSVAAAGAVIQAGPPVSDGDFDVFTYYHSTAIEDSPGGKGFMRLTVVTE